MRRFVLQTLPVWAHCRFTCLTWSSYEILLHFFSDHFLARGHGPRFCTFNISNVPPFRSSTCTNRAYSLTPLPTFVAFDQV